METEEITAPLEAVKKLSISKQYLAGNSPGGTFNEKLTTIMRGIGYIQWDPVTVVAPSHHISIWSRIGNYRWSDLDKMMFEDKEAFFHWVPIAWIVLTEDYPIFYSLMKRYPESMKKGWASHVGHAQKFMDSREELKKRVIERLRAGPAETGQFKGFGIRKKSPDGWSSGNEVTQLLFHLHMSGEVMVSGHSGNQNIWALTDDFLPGRAKRTVLPVTEFERTAAIRGLMALGAAPELDLYRYFVRGRYTNLKGALHSLLEESRIVKVKVEDQPKARPFYLLAEDRRKLDSIMSDKWEPNLNLISPFDNMITLRDRAKRLFNFDYILEQFVPREKRKFGTYVLPILWDSNLVGRIDAKLDKAGKILNVNAVYAEPDYGKDAEIGEKLNVRLEELARFLGAEKIAYGEVMPKQWGKSLG